VLVLHVNAVVKFLASRHAALLSSRCSPHPRVLPHLSPDVFACVCSSRRSSAALYGIGLLCCSTPGQDCRPACPSRSLDRCLPPSRSVRRRLPWPPSRSRPPTRSIPAAAGLDRFDPFGSRPQLLSPSMVMLGCSFWAVLLARGLLLGSSANCIPPLLVKKSGICRRLVPSPFFTLR
jgi:hypothetical protein